MHVTVASVGFTDEVSGSIWDRSGCIVSWNANLLQERDFSKAAKAATIYGSPCEDIIGHFLSVRMHVTVASFGFTDEVLFHSTFGTDRFAFCDGVQANCRRVLLAMPSR